MAGSRLTRYLGGWESATWWLPSVDTLAQMVLDAGFATVNLHLMYRLPQRFQTDGYRRAVLICRT